MKTDKDTIIQKLRNFIANETQWLTQNDQNAIFLKIDQLDEFIDLAYQSHMPKDAQHD